MDPDQHHNALNQDDMLHWYQIKSILGQGGFGITYLARDNNLDRLFAIKEYLPTEFSTRDASSTVQPISESHAEVFEWGKRRFLDEAKTLVQFEHPNIIRVHSFFENNNTGYMVMEYEEGRDFSDLIKDGENFDETRLLSVIVPILEGLELVHQQGFIHRDIKPQNIIIRDGGIPVLIDFGSARQAIGGQTRTMTSLVTPGYAPFEQYHDAEGKQGSWTDIYALGATLYCAITGKPPADSLKRGLARVEHNTDAYLKLVDLKADKYSEHFLRAIDCALEFLAKDRPSSVSDWKLMLRGDLAVPVSTDASTQIHATNSVAEATLLRETLDQSESIATEVLGDGAATATPVPPASSAPGKPGWLPGLVIAVVLLLGVVLGFTILKSPQDPAVSSQAETIDKTQAKVEQLQAELDAKSTQLKQAELEKLQAELAEKTAQLEQAEKQRKLQEEQQKQAELAQLKQQQDQEQQDKLARDQAAKKKQAEIARQQAEKKKRAELLRQQAEQKKLALLESQQQSTATNLPSNRDVSGKYATEISTESGDKWLFGKRTIVELRLQQSGNKVSGNFSGDKTGEIEGIRTDDRIKFTWYLHDSGAGSTNGKGEWVVNADGSLLEGNWKSLHYSGKGKWSMAKLDIKADTNKTNSSTAAGDFTGTYAAKISFNRESATNKKFAFGKNPDFEVRLLHENNKITGTFSGGRSGEIEGQVSGDSIKFVWYITKGGNAENGKGEWVLTPDRSGFQGSWSARGGSVAGNWNLTISQ